MEYLASTVDDGFINFGWPVYIYAKGGFASAEVIVWTGILGNIAVAQGQKQQFIAPL